MIFEVNQIVKGKAAGTFVILSFEVMDNVKGAYLKGVDPNDYTNVARGQLWLPLDCLVPIEPKCFGHAETYAQPNPFWSK